VRGVALLEHVNAAATDMILSDPEMLKRSDTPEGAADEPAHKRTAYFELKALLIRHRFLPGEQLHVAALAKRFDTSTTPIREALNRLHAEGFLVLQPHRGFFAKRLSLRELTELYEFIYLLLRRAIEKSTDMPSTAISSTLDALVDEIVNVADGRQNDVDLCATQMEQVVEKLVSFSQNDVMLSACRNFNERTHYVRSLHLQEPNQIQKSAHELESLVEKIRRRNVAAAIALLDKRLKRKIEVLPYLIKEAVSRYWA
jgi:DNA-binding GntR family transcriptional regulator